MDIGGMMKENEIGLEWLFTLAKLNNKEGLMFFEPVVAEIDGVEVSNLDPKCFLIDGAKFIYDEDMDKEIIVNAVSSVVTLTRIDGIQLNINTDEIKGFPFSIEQFKAKVFENRQQVPADHVQVE
jgi:hypothetical protein